MQTDDASATCMWTSHPAFHRQDPFVEILKIRDSLPSGDGAEENRFLSAGVLQPQLMYLIRTMIEHNLHDFPVLFFDGIPDWEMARISPEPTPTGDLVFDSVRVLWLSSHHRWTGCLADVQFADIHALCIDIFTNALINCAWGYVPTVVSLLIDFQPNLTSGQTTMIVKYSLSTEQIGWRWLLGNCPLLSMDRQLQVCMLRRGYYLTDMLPPGFGEKYDQNEFLSIDWDQLNVEENIWKTKCVDKLEAILDALEERVPDIRTRTDISVDFLPFRVRFLKWDPRQVPGHTRDITLCAVARSYGFLTTSIQAASTPANGPRRFGKTAMLAKIIN